MKKMFTKFKLAVLFFFILGNMQFLQAQTEIKPISADKTATPVYINGKPIPNTWDIQLTLNLGNTTTSTSSAPYIVLLIDKSGSMTTFGGQENWDKVKQTAQEFVKGVFTTNPKAKIAAFAYNDAIDPLTGRKFIEKTEQNKLTTKIEHLGAGGNTFTQGALHEARILLKGVSAQNKHIVILTDGMATKQYQAKGQVKFTDEFANENYIFLEEADQLTKDLINAKDHLETNGYHPTSISLSPVYQFMYVQKANREEDFYDYLHHTANLSFERIKEKPNRHYYSNAIHAAIDEARFSKEKNIKVHTIALNLEKYPISKRSVTALASLPTEQYFYSVDKNTVGEAFKKVLTKVTIPFDEAYVEDIIGSGFVLQNIHNSNTITGNSTDILPQVIVNNGGNTSTNSTVAFQDNTPNKDKIIWSFNNLVPNQTLTLKYRLKLDLSGAHGEPTVNTVSQQGPDLGGYDTNESAILYVGTPNKPGSEVGEFPRPTVTPSTDSDHDGTPDIVDLDDDNDGILDTDEMTCASQTVPGKNFDVLSKKDIIVIYNNEYVGTFFRLESPSSELILDMGRVIPAETAITFRGVGGNDDLLVAESLDNTLYSSDNSVLFSYNKKWEYQTYNLKSASRYLRIKKKGNPQYTLFLDDVFSYASFEEQNCQDRDTDSDGIPDRLDTDSDGDGCFDALEAAGGVLANQLEANGQITGEVDVNGVPSLVNGGQSTTPAVIDATDNSACVNEPCDPTVSGNLDSDGDGIADICDLDDDNDGILDDNEGFCNSPEMSGEWRWTYPDDYVGNEVTSDIKNTINGVGVILKSEPVGKNLENTKIKLSDGYFNRNNFWYNPAVAGKRSLVFNFYWDKDPENGTPYPDPVSVADDGGTRTFTLEFDKPVRYARLNFDRLGGYYFKKQPNGQTSLCKSNTAIFTMTNNDLKLIRLAGNDQFVVAGEKIYRQPDEEVDENSAAEAGPRGAAAGTVDVLPQKEGTTFTKVTFVLSGAEKEGEGYDGIEFILELCQDQDTDKDGVPDYLDLDSDNDECPDAIEGGDNVINSDLFDITINEKSGKYLGAIVGKNAEDYGVPTIVNPTGKRDKDGRIGQTVHYATDNTKNSCKNYWLGTKTSTDWNINTNWTAVEVPAPGQDVEFATTDNNNGQPAKNDLHVPGTSSSPTVIGNLINESDKALVVPAGKAITVQGKVSATDMGTNPNKLIVKAEAGKPNGTLILAGQPCGDAVKATVELYAKGEKGHSYSWQDNIPGSPDNGKEPFTGEYSWQHFGVPVKSVVADPAFYKAYLREYDEGKNDANHFYHKWKDLDNSSKLVAFKGYEITQDKPTKYAIQGDLIFCEQPIELQKKAIAVTGASGDNARYGLGQNIFGNSFTASIPIENIDFNSVEVNGALTDNSAGNLVEHTVYLYNTGTFGEWGENANNVAANPNPFVTNAGTYKAIPHNNASSIDYGKIPSMNGFLLRHVGADNTKIKMKLPYNKLEANTKPQTAPKAPLSYLEVELVSKSTVDKLWLFSQEGTTEGFDNGWDGRKFFGTPTAFIYSETPAGNMQVNTTETLENKVITFYANQDIEYTLYLKKNELQDYTHLTLLDIETGNIVPLNKEITEYNFTAKAPNVVSKRFKIVNSRNITDEMLHQVNGNIEIQQLGNKISVTNYTQQTGVMQVFDVAGKLVMSKSMRAGINKYELHLDRGAYIVTGSTQTGNGQKRIIVK